MRLIRIFAWRWEWNTAWMVGSTRSEHSSMGGSSSKTDPAAEKLIYVSRRKCQAYLTALEGCRKANKEDPAKACKNLEIKLTSCWAEDHCKEEADEHRR